MSGIQMRRKPKESNQRAKTNDNGHSKQYDSLLQSSEKSHFPNFELCVEAGDDKKKPEEGEKSACAYLDPDDGVPYDRGWAWVVVVGNFINFGLVVGYGRAGGVFFVEFLEYFQSTNIHTALLFAVRGLTFAFGGLFVMNVVVGRLGCRGTMLIGALLLSLSAVLASVANELLFLITMQAALFGVAETMIISPGEVVVASYFRRRRTLALALIKSGASVGTVVIPALVTFLLATFGLKGALLLTGAVSLHALPASLLSRPVSYFKRDREPTETANVRDIEETHKDLLDSWAVHDSDDHYEKNSSVEKGELSLSLNNNQKLNVESERTCELRACEPISISATVEEDNPAVERQSKGRISTGKRSADRNCLIVCLSSLSSLFDFSLFRRPTFRLLFAAFLCYPAVNMAVDYLPAFAKERGISEDQTADLLSIIGAIDLVGRLGSGFIVDRGLVGVFPLVTFCFSVLGVAYQCARLLTSFGSLVVLAVTQGLMASVANCLVPVLVLEVVGVDHMAKGISFFLLAAGSFIAAIHPVLGYIGDSTGSYAAVYHTIGGCSLLTAVLLGLQGPVRRLEQTTAAQ